MKSWARRLAFGIGLALAQRALAEDAFEAVLAGSSVVPGPGVEDGKLSAVLLLEGTRVTLTTTHAVARGARHGRARRMPASSGVRSRLARLHGRQAAATFSQMCSPPRERGMTWSIESAVRPQYWQR